MSNNKDKQRIWLILGDSWRNKEKSKTDGGGCESIPGNLNDLFNIYLLIFLIGQCSCLCNVLVYSGSVAF